MRPAEHVHPDLPPLRLVNRRTGEYVGACPFCGGTERSDRFHVWLVATGSRPARRFWCRACGQSGMLDHHFGSPTTSPRSSRTPWQPTHEELPTTPAPCAANIPFYRELYHRVVTWASGWLFDPANPDPLAYVRQRGLTVASARRYRLGYSLHDPAALIDYLAQQAPALLPYVEEAGLAVRDRQGTLRTHWNLCGALIFPTLVAGAVVDLRVRRAGQKAKALAGSMEARGAVLPVGWDHTATATTVVLTESGEFKTLVPQAAYEAGWLRFPTLGQPGLTNARGEWARLLVARGVERVILAYDTQPRPMDQGCRRLAPEEVASLRYGLVLSEAGLRVHVLRLPFAPGTVKADLDGFLLSEGPAVLQALIDAAPTLTIYHERLPRTLLKR
ncbi:MAG: hypothetical protein EOM24_08385, partial [Chloroflexia bacterium]|nr:hypothetical protein [Chloroflexia bacterium]